MESLVARLFGQTNLRRQNSQQQSYIPNELTYDDVDLGEDGGFLLIGVPEGERSGNDGSSSQVCSQIAAPSDPAKRMECSIQESPSVFSSKLSSPVSDVPFKIHPSLDTQAQVKNMFNGIDLETSHFDWGKYSHDFTNEKLCLRDLNSGDEVDINEFMCPSFTTTYSTSRSENLIDL